MSADTARQAEREVDPRIDLAVQRTELAEVRTLLAWLRTSIALMGAGVAFDKGAQFLHQARLEAGTALAHGGHAVGLSLTAVTTVLLTFVLWQHRKNLNVLGGITGHAPQRFQPAAFATVLVILLGIAVFAILFISN
jgi:putative membrane protein